jgi:hypothetical protein
MSSNVSPQEPTFLDMRAELSANNIAARMKLVILAQTPDKRRFPTLETVTGISENTWRTWWKRGGTPSGALVEGVAKAWPEYAFWVATGLTDVEFGHRIPPLHDSVQGYVSNYPEGKLKVERTLAAEYFKVSKELQDLSNGRNQERTSILANTMRFIAERRREQVCKGLKINHWTGNEE